MGSFTIITGKEGASPKRPLFLVSITAPDGDVCYLCTAPSYGVLGISWGGNDYQARIIKNDIQAIQAMGPQGYDSVPGFTLTLADADKFLWTNHCAPHGWRGAQVSLTFLEWDVVANQYSTDSYSFSFIGGNPQHNHQRGETTLDVMSATNFTRLKVSSVPIQYTCPWDFPATAAQRASALNDPTSPYYQCGYSPDQSGGVGNYASGTTCFTSCEKTRSSLTDPSVGCMARMGNGSRTSVAPDGDLTQDKAGHYTARFGGCTFIAPASYSGKQYVSSQKVFGFNTPNAALAGSYINFVYGTQWVQGAVLAPAADPNSMRSEVILCFAPFGAVTVWQVLVNGVMVPFANSQDPLFTWRFNSQALTPGNNSAGGRSGALCGDEYFSNSQYSGLSDPHGSMCVIEIVVPIELAAAGSVPSVQALVTSGPMLSAQSGGTIAPVAPNLTDSSEYDISTQDSIATGPSANPVQAYLDLMCLGNVAASQVDLNNWYATSQVALLTLNYVGADGNTYNHPQFKADFLISGTARQTLAAVLTGLRNSCNMMVGPNSTTGLIQSFIKQTLYDQQPAPIPGSNYNTPVPSMSASTNPPNPSGSMNGYFAYLFNETNIEKGSFRISTTRIESTPNTVDISFQDQYNSYQTDSLTQVDPDAYAYSGNQEVQVPVPMTGISNFDQGTRMANTQLAEALYGNPRNDAGGTLFFEFTVNHRVVHLAGRLGFICGLTWQSLNIGVSSPQPIRILSLKPDTDGEHWQVKAAWHEDEWYTWVYGQDPTPYQNVPITGGSNRPPYPWDPDMFVWGLTDALLPLHSGFQLGLNLAVFPAQISITGNVPVNTQPTGLPPAVPLQGSFSSTGGFLKPGTYVVAFSPNGQNGPLSNFITVVVQPGTNTNAITVSGIQWRNGAAPNIQPYIGYSPLSMLALSSAGYTSSNPDSHGNPTSFTIGYTALSGPGLPDVNLNQFLVEETPIIHGGVWGDTISSVSGAVLTFNAGAWNPSQWVGYTLSLYYRPGVVVQPGLNFKVSASTSNTLTMSHAGFQAGDVVVLRPMAGNITSNTIGDTNFQNSYNANAGLTVNAEAGNIILIIAGTGAWQSPKSIVSNTATVFTIAGSWDVTPDATSIFIVVSPSPVYSNYTQNVTGTGNVATVATVPAITNLALPQSLLITVFTADVNGNTAPMQYQPSRELYVPPLPVTVNLTSSSSSTALALLPIPQNVVADGSGGSYTITLPPFAQWLGQTINICREDATFNSANTITVQTSSSADTMAGYGTTATLTAQGQVLSITATNG